MIICRGKDIIFFFTIFGIIYIIIDQLFKFFAPFFKGGFFVIDKFFGFDFYRNYGVAFGIKIPYFLFYFLVILIIYFIFEKFKKEIKEREIYILLALLFIFSGAISNLLDRIFRGYVVDYLYLYPMSYFNLADLAILTGILMIGWKELKIK